MSLAVFGAAFVMRPLGAIAIGYYADRFGRKPALTLTITLMMVGTALIACAPPYAMVGALAPFVILVGRLLQGFSAGGEFGSATALLAEQNPALRGFFASWQFASQAMSVVLATSFGAALAMMLDKDQLDSWGWRIPFLFGVLIGPVALYIRYRIPESYEFQSLPRTGETPRQALLSSSWNILTALGLVIVATVTVYTLVLMPTFAVKYLDYPMRDVFIVGLITGVLQTVLVPVAGFLSDKWGRLPLMAGAALVIFSTTWPLLTLVATTRTFACAAGIPDVDRRPTCNLSGCLARADGGTVSHPNSHHGPCCQLCVGSRRVRRIYACYQRKPDRVIGHVCCTVILSNGRVDCVIGRHGGGPSRLERPREVTRRSPIFRP